MSGNSLPSEIKERYEEILCDNCHGVSNICGIFEDEDAANMLVL